MKDTEIDKLIQDTIDNIKEDRSKATEFMKNNKEVHASAKLLEVRQKSNDQLVKLISIIEKNRVQEESNEITEDEMEDLYKEG